MKWHLKNQLNNTILMRGRYRLLSTSSLALVLSSAAWAEDIHAPDHLAERPAVSTANGKIGVFAGSLGDGNTVGMSGALTLPLRDQFGVQLDGMAGVADHDRFYGLGAHLFWRDPTRALFGIYASHVSWDSTSIFNADANVLDGGIFNVAGADVSKTGVEAELYLGRISLEGLAAYQFGTDTGFAGRATLAYYPLDDLRFDISVKHLEGPGLTRSVGAEWAPPDAGSISFFANASNNDDDDWQAVGGVTFHFGFSDKSLIRRHREDDPGVELPDDLYLSIGHTHCPVGTHEMNGFCDGAI